MTVPKSPAVRHARAVLAGLERRNASAERIAEARAELERANQDADIDNAVATWPPLTPEQDAKLRLLLDGAA
jgi:hypothetical protein